jgi:hypothetical protein
MEDRMAKQAGSGKLRTQIDKIPADEATQLPAEEKKTGREIIRRKFQAHEEADEEDQVIVQDHDTGRTLFSGTPDEFEKLMDAIEGSE